MPCGSQTWLRSARPGDVKTQGSGLPPQPGESGRQWGTWHGDIWISWPPKQPNVTRSGEHFWHRPALPFGSLCSRQGQQCPQGPDHVASRAHRGHRGWFSGCFSSARAQSPVCARGVSVERWGFAGLCRHLGGEQAACPGLGEGADEGETQGGQQWNGGQVTLINSHDSVHCLCVGMCSCSKGCSEKLHYYKCGRFRAERSLGGRAPAQPW